MTVHCYMNMPSHYQEAFYRELGTLCKLHVVYSQTLPKERRELGWESSLNGYDFSFGSCGVSEGGVFPDRGVFHFLAGLPGGIQNAIRVIWLNSRHRFATQTEMPVLSELPPLWHVAARLYVQFLKTRRIAVFAIGKEAREYLVRLGLRNEQVFPFAYFPIVNRIGSPRFEGPMVYVGQLIKRKGVDVLFRAYSRSEAARRRELIIVGDGEERFALEALCNTLGIERYVRFVGAQKASATIDILGTSSCLVLPSRFDGWGVVVNEAISLGVPVIVSDKCGAAELVEKFGCGFVFKSDYAEALAEDFDKLFVNENHWSIHAARARDSLHTISPKKGAEYFLSVVQYVRGGYVGERPTPPWFALFSQQ